MYDPFNEQGCMRGRETERKEEVKPIRGFQTGSVVRLKSGGPLLTVILSNSSKTLCGWFNVDASYCERELLTSILVLVQI